MTLLQLPSSKISDPRVPRLKSWTVAEYHRLSAAGILTETDRTELLAGQVVLMAAKGTRHVTTLQLLADQLRQHLGVSALVRVQDPIQLDDRSEPEPDLALVRGTVLDYQDHHPQPADLYLVVEVADTTVKQDCEVKAALYAQAGITDYWVVDVHDRQLHVFRDPTATGYTQHLILREPNSFQPLAFPALTIALTEILPAQA